MVATSVSSASVSSAPGAPSLNNGTAVGGWAGGQGRSRLTGMRRRSVPHLVVGALLVVACAVGGVLVATRLGDRVVVLALARPVAVGQVVAVADVRQVSVSADSGLDLVPAADAASVVGQSAAFALPAGALVTRSMVGAARVPAAGMAVVAVGLKPGAFPPELAVGATVAVLTTVAPEKSWTAVVTGVSARESEQVTVVSLQLSEQDARAVAVVPAGQVSLVTVGGR